MVKPEVERPATGRSLTYLPWMDGMRAIAVIAVMVYHETISQPKLGGAPAPTQGLRSGKH